MYLQISRKKVELFQNQRDQIVQLYMSVKSSDMMSNSNNHLYKTTISSKNATPKKQRLLGDFPQQTPRVFSTTLASPAAARASASAAFKTAGWAASLGVEVAVFYLIIYISFQKKMPGGWPWGILNQLYVDPICFCIESSEKNNVITYVFYWKFAPKTFMPLSSIFGVPMKYMHSLNPPLFFLQEVHDYTHCGRAEGIPLFSSCLSFLRNL